MKWLLAFAACLELFTPWVASYYVALPCTGQEALQIAEKAVELINADRKRGYKYALDRIENVQRKNVGDGSYYLDIEVRETVCHVLNHKPLSSCNIRSFTATKADGDCDVLIETTPEGTKHLDGYKCDVSPDSHGDIVKVCPDCPGLIPSDSESAINAALVSLKKFNDESNHMHRFELQEIGRSYILRMLNRIVVEYVLRETTCLKNSDICTLQLLQNPEIVFCKSNVGQRMSAAADIEQNCEFFGNQQAAVDRVGAAPEGEGTAIPEAGGSMAPPVAEDQLVTHDDVVYDHLTAQPDTETAILQASGPQTFPPKRKRSANSESSESSEEIIPKVTVVFPNLPADPSTCPGRHKYHEYS
ncbi:alpha-2-HS-glycoprotein-like [Mobula birostris]|uniref:alpha-2-HS-glycoprotein-like n=1 Tax=Mobula birostris TaxID=1983395 RepID=UPI003B284F48